MGGSLIPHFDFFIYFFYGRRIHQKQRKIKRKNSRFLFSPPFCTDYRNHRNNSVSSRVVVLIHCSLFSPFFFFFPITEDTHNGGRGGKLLFFLFDFFYNKLG